ncbi:MAG: hypothetical protein K0U68_15305 [Gammaproteobacteria bacterium]|nr:hypothetical protein [Gammaproteobacteria bacterium]
MKRTIVEMILSILLLVFTSHLVNPVLAVSSDSAMIKRLTEAEEDQWVRLNNNQFQDVWTPESQRPFIDDPRFLSGIPHSVIGAWSSMAWDSSRWHLIFWGGGHANYTGNEVYRWNANTLLWERASLPSEIKQVNTAVNENWFETVGGIFDAPISSHTYDNSEFLPIADRFITFGGASYTLGGSFNHTNLITQNTGPYLWDPSRADPNKTGGSDSTQVNPELFPGVAGGKMWENRDNWPQQDTNTIVDIIEETTAYSEENGKDVIFFTMNQQLFKYTLNDITSADLDSYELIGRPEAFTYSGQGAGAYDPTRKLYVRTSGDEVAFWDLNESNPITTKAILSNPENFDLSRLFEYGMDFDSRRSRFVLWGGGQDLWALNPPANSLRNVWQLRKIKEPGKLNEFNLGFVGVLGKWKYIAELDVFLGVADSLTGDVWAYKPTDWAGVSAAPPELPSPIDTPTPPSFDPEPADTPSNQCANLVCASETGNLFVSHLEQTIQFSQTMAETPVVIAGVPSFFGTQPGVIHPYAITGSEFKIRFREWNYLDGVHIEETAGYLAIMPGLYQLEDGGLLEVGRTQVDGNIKWKNVDLITSSNQTPYLFATLQTQNGADIVMTRIRNVTSRSFEIALFEQESLIETNHLKETVGYIAFYPAQDNGLLPIGNQILNYSLALMTMNTGGTSVFGHRVVMEEEQSADQELGHVAEKGYFMILGSEETLYGQVASDHGLDPFSLRRK